MDVSRILLIYPPLDLEERFGAYSDFGSNSAPLGIIYLGSHLAAHGLDVDVLDACGFELSLEEALAHAQRTAPDLIGISAEALSIDRAARLIALLKRALPAIPIVLGGYHVSVLPEETLGAVPGIDYAVLGDGEDTTLELVEHLRGQGKPLAEIDGLAFRRGEEETIVVNRRRPNRKSLAGLAMPDFGLLHGFEKRNPYFASAYRHLLPQPSVSIVASRGCPFDCYYCCRKVDGRLYRPYPVDDVLDLMEDLVERFGSRSFLFEDEIFYMKTSTIQEFAEKKRARGLTQPWVASYRIDAIDEERVRWFKESGCAQLAFGIESGSPRILKNLNKVVDIGLVRENLAMVKSYGISTVSFFMLGCPGETIETLEETERLALEADLDYIVLFNCQPSPGSKLYEEHDKWGVFANDFHLQNQVETVFIPHGLDAETLERYRRRIFNKFYFRPKRVLQELRFVTKPAYVASVARYLWHQARLPSTHQARQDP